MKLSLFTPEKTLLKDEEVKEIQVPSIKGYLGILPGHCSMVSLLESGVLTYWKNESQKEKLAVSWGYVEVENDRVRILSESAATKETLDKAKIKKELVSIKKSLSNPYLEPKDKEELEKKRQWLESELEL